MEDLELAVLLQPPRPSISRASAARSRLSAAARSMVPDTGSPKIAARVFGFSMRTTTVMWLATCVK